VVVRVLQEQVVVQVPQAQVVLQGRVVLQEHHQRDL
jgi:hypothetical protein